MKKSTDTYAPKPTIILTETEREIYDAVCGFLKKNKAIEKVDAYQITMLAKCWGRYDYCERQLAENEENLIQTFEQTGAQQLSPIYTIMDKEMARFDKLARHFGLNQEAREKLLCFKVDANTTGGIISKLTAIREKSKKVI